ncbi:MAG: hypothetical protein L6R39_002223, partial [Caloplaca ligustica]
GKPKKRWTAPPVPGLQGVARPTVPERSGLRAQVYPESPLSPRTKGPEMIASEQQRRVQRSHTTSAVRVPYSAASGRQNINVSVPAARHSTAPGRRSVNVSVPAAQHPAAPGRRGISVTIPAPPQSGRRGANVFVPAAQHSTAPRKRGASVTIPAPLKVSQKKNTNPFADPARTNSTRAPPSNNPFFNREDRKWHLDSSSSEEDDDDDGASVVGPSVMGDDYSDSNYSGDDVEATEQRYLDEHDELLKMVGARGWSKGKPNARAYLDTLPRMESRL